MTAAAATDPKRAFIFRVTVGIALLAAIITLAWLDQRLVGDNTLVLAEYHPLFFLLIYVLSAFALNEFQGMLAQSRNLEPYRLLTQLALFALLTGELVFSKMASTHPAAQAGFYLSIITALPLIFIQIQAWSRRPMAVVNLGTSFFALAYIGFPSLCILKFLLLPGVGSWGLLYLILVAKSADIFGYLVGRKWGKHKIVPRISPKKSWEGGIAGLIGSLTVASIMPSVFGLDTLFPVFIKGSCIPGPALWFGLAVGIGSQLGDWAESLLKRDCEIKDSGTLLPEFGGFLDIIDCLLVAGPLALWISWLVV